MSSVQSSSADFSPAAEASVWSSLLRKATRKNKEINSTLIVLGDKRSGKSTLLSKFPDRVSTEQSSLFHNSSTVASTGSSTDATSAAIASAESFGVHGVDYSYTSVKNKHASAGEKDEVVARMHVWTLDDVAHASLIPLFLRANQSSSHLAAPSASTSAFAEQKLDYQTLDSAFILLTFDLSEPWHVLESVTAWLSALSTVLKQILDALPPAQASQLRKKISAYTQSYYAPQLNDESNSTNPAASNNDNPSSTDDTSSSPSSSSSAADSSLVDTSKPVNNLGVPILLAGLKADGFGKHLTGSTDNDQKFEYLTRQLRKIALEYGAGIIYTGSATASGTSKQSAKEAIASGVNIDVLQNYVFHRLYKFALNPYANSAAGSAEADPKVASPSNSAAVAAAFAPKVIGGVEDDFGIYIPAGYDSADLLETTSRNAISAAYNDKTPSDDVFKSALTAAQRKKKALKGFETVTAEDNSVFLQRAKQFMESGSNASAMSVADGIQSMMTNAAALRQPKVNVPTPSATATPMVDPKAGVKPTISPSSAASTPSSAAASASAGAAGAAGAAPVKGQIAVKQFFRSLLNNNSKPEGNSKAAAQQKAVRASAERELQRMTNETQPNP